MCIFIAPYVAPEVLCRNEYRAQPTDVWSTGIVLIAMLAGELPWDKPVFECPEFVSWIKNNSYAKSPWCKIENSALSLIKNILNYEPEQRFTIRQIKESAWYKRVAKSVQYTSMIDHNKENGFLSQPTYVYLNDKGYGSASSQSTFMSSMAAELNMTDSQQNCECSSHHHVESFSQPISTDNMILNSQINATQSSSQYSQSPFLRMVKRLTRVFMHSSLDICTEKVKEVLQKLMYDFKLATLNQSQRQITVITSDKRQTLLTFKINIIEMNSQSGVLVDFRLSKGDGLEFKKIFMKIKANLNTYVCKRYVFVNSHACCEKQFHC
jgi:serine/threonine-protein kinase Chk1